jgi:uncharacterized protein YneF (UPF0154 family)
MYEAGLRFGILDELFGKRQQERYSKEEVREYMKAHPEIRRIKDLKNANARIYNAAYKLKMYDEFFSTKYQRSITYTEEDLMKYLSDHPEIKTREDLLKSNKSLYYLARKLRLLVKLFGICKRKWTEETIKQYIKDNPDITRRVDLMNKAMGAYYRANQLKILDELFPKK